ncbi:zinc finger protein 573-like [Phlebotomus argentipes]|uniref:zinc finger protein 573-like n=1 Tax=Phlebotomus argentipes TaxID=94469 RepID=UPI002892E045|nr:zinc finger protein 573-like [Phlebotomus argentipes]
MSLSVSGEIVELEDESREKQEELEALENDTCCRLCLHNTQAEMYPFQDMTYNNIPFCNLFFQIVGITFTDYPEMSANICIYCANHLTEAFKFREKCLRTEEKLKDLLKKEEVKEASIEFIPTQGIQERLELVKKEMNEAVEGKSVEFPELPIDFTGESTAKDREKSKKIVYKFSRSELKKLELKKIQCSKCEEKFKGIELFKKHACNAKSRKSQEKSAQKKDRDKRKIEIELKTLIPPKEVFPCAECGHKASSRQAYVKHMNRKHWDIKPDCSTRPVYGCHLCGKKFDSQYHIQKHVYKIHLKKHPIECAVCEKGFYTRNGLTRHMDAYHLNLTFQCDVCGKTFKSNARLSDHVKTHSGKKTCELCGKTLTSILGLAQHMKVHREKEYMCPVCLKEFAHNFAMRTHVKKFHPDDEHLLPPKGTIINRGFLKKVKEREQLPSQDMEEWTVCRLCLKSSSDAMKSIPDLTYNMIPFFNIYFELIGVTFTDYAAFPGRICHLCEKNMIMAYKFREKCLETEEKLKEFLCEGSEISSTEFIVTLAASKEDISKDLQDTSANQLAEIKTEEESAVAEASDGQEFVVEETEAEEQHLQVIECKYCKKLFKNIKMFGKHVCRLSDMLQKSRKQKSTPARKIYECTKCQQTYNCRSAWMIHMDRHNNFLRYACDQCDKKFSNWLQRRNHVYRVHLKRKFCECSHCGKGFYKKHDLTVHMNAVHLKTAAFQCDTCGKTYHHPKNFRNHVKSHNPATVKCSVCGKVLKNEKTLVQHSRVHSAKKNYVCPVCSEAFTWNATLKSHVRRLHPDKVHLLPPDGTIVNRTFLRKLAEESE